MSPVAQHLKGALLHSGQCNWNLCNFAYCIAKWLKCTSWLIFQIIPAWLHTYINIDWILQRSFLLSHVPFLISFEKSYLITSSSLWKFPGRPAKSSLLCNIRYIMVHHARVRLDPRLPSWQFNEMLKIIRRDSGPFSHVASHSCYRWEFSLPPHPKGAVLD